jgi:hypothetical protein
MCSTLLGAGRCHYCALSAIWLPDGLSQKPYYKLQSPWSFVMLTALPRASVCCSLHNARMCAVSPDLADLRLWTPKPHPQRGKPPIEEVLVSDTSRDGRAGGEPLTPSTAGTRSAKCASRPCNGTQEIAKSFWSYFFYGGLS